LRFDVTAMEMRDMFYDRQAQACPSNVFGSARFVGAIEPFENARQIFFANTDATVTYAKNNFSVTLQSDQSDLAMLARIFHCVIEQVIEGFLQSYPVSPNGWQVGRNIDNDVELFACQFLFPITNHFFKQARQIDSV